jgi:hypothetical protein
MIRIQHNHPVLGPVVYAGESLELPLAILTPEEAQIEIADKDRPMFTLADMDDDPHGEPDDFEGVGETT